MKCALHTGAVVGVERANALCNMVDLSTGDLSVEQRNFTVHKAGSGNTTEVDDDLQQFLAVVRLLHGVTDIGGEDI